MVLSIHLEIFIDFLKQKCVEKYGQGTARTQYIHIFLDSLNDDIQTFLGMDFFELKNSKEIELAETAKINAEYLSKKNLNRNEKI